MTTEQEVIAIAKRVSSREIESPITKADWLAVLKEYASDAFPDPGLSEAQKFSKALDTEIGKELFWASKAAPRQVAASSSSEIADERYGRTLTLEEARALGPASQRERRFSVSLRGDRGPSNPPGEGRSGPGGMTHDRGASYRPGTGSARKSATEKERAQRTYQSSGSAWPQI